MKIKGDLTIRDLNARNINAVSIPITNELIFTNTTILQALAASSEIFAHNKGNQFPMTIVAYKPVTGTYAGKWINAEGVLTIEYLDINNVKITNDSSTAIAIGDAKIMTLA